MKTYLLASIVVIALYVGALATLAATVTRPATVSVVYWNATKGNFAIEKTTPAGVTTVTVFIGGKVVAKDIPLNTAFALAKENGVL